MKMIKSNQIEFCIFLLYLFTFVLPVYDFGRMTGWQCARYLFTSFPFEYFGNEVSGNGFLNILFSIYILAVYWGMLLLLLMKLFKHKYPLLNLMISLITWFSVLYWIIAGSLEASIKDLLYGYYLILLSISGLLVFNIREMWLKRKKT